MLIKDGVWPDSTQMLVKVEGQYKEVAQGYSKINGIWVPWDFSGDMDVDLNIALSNKNLNGLTLILSKVFPNE